LNQHLTVEREAKPGDPSGDNAAKISQAGDLLDFAVDKTRTINGGSAAASVMYARAVFKALPCRKPMTEGVKPVVARFH
jgi:hypothetical protein